ncbi:hypothetical protein DL240_06950 [Lujinxingia litoralis]|uniref:Uncharacterized protein n=1 Tax=Lujinxingia litoralis TaxID=2211119 RepID=A0A328C8Q7_9DELT|nr:hypothetical protein DL240_06950 [Lujinxingia litoralis]
MSTSRRRSGASESCSATTSKISSTGSRPSTCHKALKSSSGSSAATSANANASTSSGAPLSPTSTAPASANSSLSGLTNTGLIWPTPSLKCFPSSLSDALARHA